MVEFLFSFKFLILVTFFSSACYIHYRGVDRHKFTRQLTDHSTFLAPLNALIYSLSAVPAKPYLDRENFSDLDILKENWEVIKEEALELIKNDYIKTSNTYNDVGFNSFFKKGWKRFYIKWYGDYHPSAKEVCPKTIELLEKTTSVKAALFALLPPGGKLVRHRDPFAGSLRYHLGLITPNSDKCRIYVDGQQYYWKDGEDVVFDETYIHYAINESDTNRVILFCDIERPMKYKFATALNKFFSRLMSLASSPNSQDDKTGGINKIFKYVYSIRIVGKKLKTYNRKLYYAVKYILFGTILALIFF